MQQNPHRTLIYAHRGANREAPENSRAAFDKALDYAVDGIETDVQLSRDEVTLLWHDRFLDKLGLPGKHIDDFDYAELRRMSFAGYSPPVAGRESVMTLETFVETYGGRCRLLIEVKNRDYEAISRHEIKMRQCLDILSPYGDGTNEGRLLISSFNLDSLIFAHRCAQTFPLVYNLENDRSREDVARVLKAHPFLHGLCVPIENLDGSMSRLLRDHGKCVAAYTCNSDEEIAKALELGIDILITDEPAKALRMRN